MQWAETPEDINRLNCKRSVLKRNQLSDMAFINIQTTLCVCVLLAFQCVLDINAGGKGRVKEQCVNDTKPCGDCGRWIRVTLRVENEFLEPFFNVSVNLIRKQRQLIYFLQDAVDKKEEFRFSADFYPSLGYFITSMNKRQADSNYFWGIYDGDGKFTSCGVSSYVPRNRETVTFKFTPLSSYTA